MGLNLFKKKGPESQTIPEFQIIAKIPGGPRMTKHGGDACSPTNYEPIVTENDVEFYDWKYGVIELKEQSLNTLQKKFGKSMEKLNMTEFEAKVCDKKLYDGLIEISSIDIFPSPPAGRKLITFISRSRDLYIIKSAEIKEFFKKLGKLKE